MKAELLIDAMVEGRLNTGRPRRGFVHKPRAVITKSDFLSASEVAKLKPRQGIIVDGRKGRVIQVEILPRQVSLTYVIGTKSFGSEESLVFDKANRKTSVKSFTKEYIDESQGKGKGWTRGMKRTVEKLPSKMSCPECGFSVPKYPGRYPKFCPECSALLVSPEET